MFGFLGAALGMKVTWYKAPIAALIGRNGGNIGHELTFAFSAVAFPLFRWTEKRWSSEGLLYVNLQHIHDRHMRYVIRWIYEDPQEQLFENLDFCRSVDEVLNFMFEIIDVAVSFIYITTTIFAQLKFAIL